MATSNKQPRAPKAEQPKAPKGPKAKQVPAGTVAAATGAQAAQTAPQAAAPAQAAPAPATPAPATPAPLAVRGGLVLGMLQVAPGKQYRTKAPHNVAWWAVITAQATAQPVAAATLVAAGVPSHFLGYAVRRGYLGNSQPQAANATA